MFRSHKKQTFKTASKQKKLLDNLTESPIFYDTFKAPIIASDLIIYSATEYDKLLRPGAISPFTREPLNNKMFPVQFLAFDEYCRTPSMKNLIELVRDPISRKIMSKPIIAHMEYETIENRKQSFVVICDESSLELLPKNIRCIRRREWDELKKTIDFFKGELSKKRPFATQSFRASHWYEALETIICMFPLQNSKDVQLFKQPLIKLDDASRHERKDPSKQTLRQSPAGKNALFKPQALPVEPRPDDDLAENSLWSWCCGRR